MSEDQRRPLDPKTLKHKKQPAVRQTGRLDTSSTEIRQSDFISAHLELVVSVFGSFVEGSVVTESADVVDAVEALDAIGDSVHLEDGDAVRHRRHRVDLQV